jgi:carboxymethylenebutenolidase
MNLPSPTPETKEEAARRVVLATADGPMAAYVVAPSFAGPHPALVVVPEAFGVNAHIRDVCRRFAARGYLAIAPEIYHRAGAGLEIPYADMPPAMAQLALLSNAGIEQDLAAALAHARGRPDVDPARVGVVGFCVGGFAAFLAACRLDPAATVSFYGGGIVRPRAGLALQPLLEEAGGIRAPLLCLFGSADGGIPGADVEAIRQRLAGLDGGHEVVVYEGAGHAFFCDARPAYHAPSAQAAWERTLGWFERHL